ncbi:hypothetical protein D3C86_1473670 [compost metagenome]
MAVLSQRTQDGIGYGADAHLQSGTIFDQPGDVVGDLASAFADRADCVLHGRPVGKHNGIQVVVSQGPISVGPGCLGIDFCDDQARAVECWQQVLAGNAQAVAALGVGRRQLQHQHIDAQGTAGDQLGQLGVVAGQYLQ